MGCATASVCGEVMMAEVHGDLEVNGAVVVRTVGKLMETCRWRVLRVRAERVRMILGLMG